MASKELLRGLFLRGLCSGSSFCGSHFCSSLSFLFFLSLRTLCGDSLNGWAVVSLGQRSVEQIQLGRLLFCNLQGALSAWQALSLLPDTGDLQQCENWLGWLCANADPVLSTLRIDLDNGWLFLWLVDAESFDSTAGTAGAGVRNNNAVRSMAYHTDSPKLHHLSPDGLRLDV